MNTDEIKDAALLDYHAERATRRVVIMRGIPGSGKSTFVRRHEPSSVVCSADAYFTNPDGLYRFEPRSLPAAHADCLGRFKDAAKQGAPAICVDNTNILLEHIRPYLAFAEASSYAVYIVHCLTELETCVARNVHNVPRATIVRMSETFESIPDFWNVRKFTFCN